MIALIEPALAFSQQVAAFASLVGGAQTPEEQAQDSRQAATAANEQQLLFPSFLP